jgi:hypothetical protein
MPAASGTPYFHAKPFSKMEEYALLNAIRKVCRVIGKGIMPAPDGITIITEQPVGKEKQKALGLVPLEDL